MSWIISFSYLLKTENHSTENLPKEVIVNTKTKVNGGNKEISDDSNQEMQKQCNCINKENCLVDSNYFHKIYCI